MRAARAQLGGARRRRRLDRRDLRARSSGARPRSTGSAACACAATRASRPRSPWASPRRPPSYVVTIDGDGQDDPANIPKLLSGLEDGRPGLRLEAASARPMDPPSRVAAVQPGHRRALGREASRHELRLQGLPGRVCPLAADLRRAPPIPPGARPSAGVAGRGAPGQPPATGSWPVAVRGRALPAGRPRPAHGQLPGPLPTPPAAPVRRDRPLPDPGRASRSRSTC